MYLLCSHLLVSPNCQCTPRMLKIEIRWEVRFVGEMGPRAYGRAKNLKIGWAQYLITGKVHEWLFTYIRATGFVETLHPSQQPGCLINHWESKRRELYHYATHNCDACCHHITLPTLWGSGAAMTSFHEKYQATWAGSSMAQHVWHKISQHSKAA